MFCLLGPNCKGNLSRDEELIATVWQKPHLQDKVQSHNVRFEWYIPDWYTLQFGSKAARGQPKIDDPAPSLCS